MLKVLSEQAVGRKLCNFAAENDNNFNNIKQIKKT